MIRIIKSHNELNGIKFVIAEFGFMALLLILIALYCLFSQKYLVAFVFGGIGLNCLPVVYYGMREVQNKQPRSGSIWNPQAREQLIARNPHMMRDTIVLTGATLVPLLVVLIVFWESQFGKRSG